MQKFTVKITADLEGMRLDQALALAGVELSKRKIRQVIDVGGAYVNRKRVRIASRMVQAGDVVQLEYVQEALKKINRRHFEILDSDILFDDHGIVALNKPPGLPSQATRDQAILHVATCLTEYFAKKKNERRRTFTLVHRLDKETSGVILVATTPQSTAWCMALFKDRRIKKTYRAICSGVPKQPRFTVECFLSDIDRRTGDVRVVRSGGKKSKTDFVLLNKSPSLPVSLLECRPETGRSHQIRVHLESVGLPILGDKRYGRSVSAALPPEISALTAQHHFLHAQSLQFAPSQGAPDVTISAPYPPEFSAFLAATKLENR